MLVVADTSPLRYLIEIDQIRVLPQLFPKIFIPTLVHAELCHSSAPAAVREWARLLPGWLEVRPAPPSDDPAYRGLDAGETAALALGVVLRADLILIDDRKGAAVAARSGFAPVGVLGVLARGAQHGFVDLAEALARLGRTNFRYRRELFDELLRRFSPGS